MGPVVLHGSRPPIGQRRGAASRWLPGLVMACAVSFASGAAQAAAAAPAAPAPVASAASAARASQAAVDSAERRQADEAERQSRAERQAHDSQQAALQQRRRELCSAKKTMLQDAQRSPDSAPDRQGVIDRATVAMTLACQAAR